MFGLAKERAAKTEIASSVARLLAADQRQVRMKDRGETPATRGTQTVEQHLHALR